MAGSCALWVPVGAPWAHPQVGWGLGGRASLLCPKGGPETSPCIAGSWVRAQGPTPTPGTVPLPGGPCRALMEQAGYWGAQRPPSSRCCCPPPRGLASHAPGVWAGRLSPTAGYLAHPDSSILQVASLSARERVQVREAQWAGPIAGPIAALFLRSPSIHVGADGTRDAERLCGDGDVLVVHRAVVVGGDVGVEERQLHGTQAG